MKFSNLNVTLVGRGSVVLRPANYVTTGGEASIYRLTDTIVKIFTDPTKMSVDRMAEKIGLLAAFKHPYIVAPRGVVEDARHNLIGYYMGFAEGDPMSRVFTTAFRQRDGFTDKDAIRLVHNIREVILYAHQQGAILVDANELNWLMNRTTEPEPRIVDVDSWQLGTKWPARVIMPSIRDWHTHGFNEESDWFSYAIVTFQVFSGIHPYRGRHDGYSNNEIERRMKDNVSVFNKDVHLNAAVRPFSAIPGHLLDWYQKVFEHGERTQPPSSLDQTRTTTIAARRIQPVTASGSLVFEMIMARKNETVVRVYPCGIVLCQDGALIDLLSKRYLLAMTELDKSLSPRTEIIKTDKGYLIADRGKFYHMTPDNWVEIPLATNYHSVLHSGNRMFVITDDSLIELNLIDMGKLILTLGRAWNIMGLSTEWFDGVGVQNALGAKYLVLPFGDKSCSFIRAAELDDVTVVTAKAGFRFVSVIALNKVGEYKKFEFCLDHDHAKYTLWEGGTDSPDLNLAILPSGVGATVVEDHVLTIFVPQNGKLNKVADKKIDTSMHLCTWGDKVLGLKDGEVWWIRMK